MRRPSAFANLPHWQPYIQGMACTLLLLIYQCPLWLSFVTRTSSNTSGLDSVFLHVCWIVSVCKIPPDVQWHALSLLVQRVPH